MLRHLLLLFIIDRATSIGLCNRTLTIDFEHFSYTPEMMYYDLYMTIVFTDTITQANDNPEEFNSVQSKRIETMQRVYTKELDAKIGIDELHIELRLSFFDQMYKIMQHRIIRKIQVHREYLWNFFPLNSCRVDNLKGISLTDYNINCREATAEVGFRDMWFETFDKAPLQPFVFTPTRLRMDLIFDPDEPEIDYGDYTNGDKPEFKALFETRHGPLRFLYLRPETEKLLLKEKMQEEEMRLKKKLEKEKLLLKEKGENDENEGDKSLLKDKEEVGEVLLEDKEEDDKQEEVKNLII